MIGMIDYERLSDIGY